MRTRKPPGKGYMRVFGALYGSEEQMDLPLVVPKKKKKRSFDEDVEQIKFNLWFDDFLWDKDYRWFHPANGGSRTLAEGSKFKRMGVKAGVPDIIVPMASKSYHGLVIELKRRDGRPSDVRAEQKDWLAWFKRHNWANHVAYGFNHAKEIVMDYFGL